MTTQSDPLDLSSMFLRLRSDASIEPLAVDNTFWQRLTSGQLGDFHNEILIACSTFGTGWPMWEMHPNVRPRPKGYMAYGEDAGPVPDVVHHAG